MAADPTWGGLLRGLLVPAALWWAWAAYAWLTNTIDAERTSAPLAMFAAMGAMLIAALATPEAFGADGVLFGCAYSVVRAMHIVLYAEGSPDVNVRQAAIGLAPTSTIAPAVLILAGFLDGPVQLALWAVALAIDFSGPYVRGVGGFTVSPSHFVERFGLIVIIALGESIVAIGLGASGLELGPGLVAGAVLGLAVAASAWWRRWCARSSSRRPRPSTPWPPSPWSRRSATA